MVVFPNAKINLGLNIVRKRTDGFHDLETVFYPLHKCRDVLEVVHMNATDPVQDTDVIFSSSGTEVPGDHADNLCMKAYRLLKQVFPSLPAIRMHLHKAIPMGAGLGGGSADGAFTLQLLNRKFNLGITDDQMIDYALALGSDCPFFVKNEPCFATGRGEKLEKMSFTLESYTIVLVSPQIHINTGWAFSQIRPAQPQFSVQAIVQQPPELWKEHLHNDFEVAVFRDHPEVGSIKSKLYEAGAVYASMSGSGSTVYGIFDKRPDQLANFPAHYGLTIL